MGCWLAEGLLRDWSTLCLVETVPLDPFYANMSCCYYASNLSTHSYHLDVVSVYEATLP